MLVTGGCGFIGSHLVDALIAGKNTVTVFDNLSSGSLDSLERCRDSRKVAISRRDLKCPNLRLNKEFEIIYHLAANPEVRVGTTNPEIHFRENVVATYNLLEAARRLKNLETFVFLSTSTVYGEAKILPTPENYGPMLPISTYGASKLASESLVSAYASSYGFKAVIFRLANIIGARSNHGIIHDIMLKLKKNQKELEILGDGTQTKSYLHVADCIAGILIGVDKSKDQVDVFNVGSEDQINVMKIVRIICNNLDLHKVKFLFNKATPDGRGWIGDVKFMRLDISKLKSLGWRPKMSSEEAVLRAVHELMSQEKK